MGKQKNRCERNVAKTAATAKNSAQPSRKAKKVRVAGDERRHDRAIEHEALTDMGFDAEYLYWAGMEDIGCK